LNYAWKSGPVASDDPWRRVKPFRAAETTRVRYLFDAQCVRLLNACEPALHNLVRGALLTGCRYSELISTQLPTSTPTPASSQSARARRGKPRHVVLTDEGQSLFATLTAGRLGSDPIFTRADGAAWGTSHRLRPMAEACARAKIKPAISCPAAHAWFNAGDARRAYGSHCRTTRPCGHAHDGKALRASCSELCCRHDPSTFPNARHC
jgi:integrase